MSGNSPDFVKWREEFVSQERGSRVVHYYLEDSKGDSHLAVVGTERSLRHMLYVVSEEFCQAYGPDKWGVSCLKWRSRREVVDWLTSFLPGKTCTESMAVVSMSSFNMRSPTRLYRPFVGIKPGEIGPAR